MHCGPTTMIPMSWLHKLVVFCLTTSLVIEPGLAQTLNTTSDKSDGSGAPTSIHSINDLTKKILLKEIELSRLNTRFRMETSLVSPWRQRRMFVYAQANSWLTQASLIRQMQLRYKLAKDKRPLGSNRVSFDTENDLPDQAQFIEDEDLAEEFTTPQTSPNTTTDPNAANLQAIDPRAFRQNGKERGRLAAANEAQLVGQLIGAGGDCFEVGLNFYNYLKLRRRGLTPALYRNQVQLLHTQLDELLSERKKICDAAVLSQAEQEVVSAEGKLITDLRDLALMEYYEFHAATKRFWTLQNTAYFVDFTKNMLGATGNIVSLTGNHWRRPRMQGGAGIFSILSGTTVLLTPFVGRVTGNVSGLAARRLVSKELNNVGVKNLNIFTADRQKFLSLVQKPSAQMTDYVQLGVTGRLPLYDSAEKLLQDTVRYQESQEKRARATLKENILFAGIVAPPRIANGITQVIGGWRYYTNPPLANKFFAAGATAYASGTAVNIAETIRVQASFERRYHKQVKTHSTPREQFLNRLKRLDDMNKIVSVNQAN